MAIKQLRLHKRWTHSKALLDDDIKETGEPVDQFLQGDTPFVTFDALLGVAGANMGDRFVDLGCTWGRLPLYAFLTRQMPSIGIERLSGFVSGARKMMSGLGVSDDQIRIQQGDMRQVSLADADLVFVAATAFSDAFMVDMDAVFNTLPKGGKLILVTHALPNDAFNLVYAGRHRFHWGQGTVRIYEKQL